MASQSNGGGPGGSDGKVGNGFQNPNVAKNAAALADSQAQLKNLQTQIATQKLLQQQGVDRGPGYEALAQTDAEKQAGVTPPGYQGTTDKAGNLLNQYALNPYSGQAEKTLQTMGNSVGPSAMAQEQLRQQALDEAKQRGATGLQGQQAQDSAMAQLSRLGGLSGGARTSLARSGARDLLNAQQGVSAAGATARYGITDADNARKFGILGNEASTENQAAQQNIGTSVTGLQNRAQFDANRYNQQMQAWASKQSADATRAAGGGGGKGK